MFMLSVWFENIACYAVRKPLRLQVFFITKRYGLSDGHTMNGLRGRKSAPFCRSAENFID